MINCIVSGYPAAETAQQTQNICITFVQRWTNVGVVGPDLVEMLYKCFVFAGRFLMYTSLGIQSHDPLQFHITLRCNYNDAK